MSLHFYEKYLDYARLEYTDKFPKDEKVLLRLNKIGSPAMLSMTLETAQFIVDSLLEVLPPKVAEPQRIKIGRYSDTEREVSPYSGWIEDEGKSWIIYLGADGKPMSYFPSRDATGAVIVDSLI